MTDIPEPESQLWLHVKEAGFQHMGLGAADYLWPPDSESDARDLGDAWSRAATALKAAIQDSYAAAKSVYDNWPDSAGFHVYHTIQSLNSGLHELVTELEELAAACKNYAQSVSDAKNAIYAELAINVGLFALAAAFGGPAGAAAFAARLFGQIAAKIALYAGRVASAVNRLGKFKKFGVKLLGDTLKESFEEVVIDQSSQYLSELQGYRDGIDYKQTLTAGVAGALGEPMGRAVNKLGVRKATDGLGNLAARRMPNQVAEHVSKGVNSAVSNGLTSPAASIVADGLVNKHWDMPTGRDYLGNAIAAGAMATTRTNPELAGHQIFEHRTGQQPPHDPPHHPPQPTTAGDLSGSATGSSDAGTSGSTTHTATADAGSVQGDSQGSSSTTQAEVAPQTGTVHNGTTPTVAGSTAAPVVGTAATHQAAVGSATAPVQAANTQTTTSAQTTQAQSAKTEQAQPTKTEQAQPTKTEQAQTTKGEPNHADTDLDTDQDGTSEPHHAAEAGVEAAAQGNPENDPTPSTAPADLPADLRPVWNELTDGQRDAFLGIAAKKKGLPGAIAALTSMVNQATKGNEDLQDKGLPEKFESLSEEQRQELGKRLESYQNKGVGKQGKPGPPTPAELRAVYQKLGALANIDDVLRRLADAGVDTRRAETKLREVVGKVRDVLGRGPLDEAARTWLEGVRGNFVGVEAELLTALLLTTLTEQQKIDLGLPGLTVESVRPRMRDDEGRNLTDIDVSGRLGDGTEVRIEIKAASNVTEEGRPDARPQAKNDTAHGDGAKLVFVVSNMDGPDGTTGLEDLASELLGLGYDSVLHHGHLWWNIEKVSPRNPDDSPQPTRPEQPSGDHSDEITRVDEQALTGEGVVYAPAGMSIGDDPATGRTHLRAMMVNRPDEGRPYLVTLQGSATGPSVSPKWIAEATRNGRPHYTEGRPVRLNSCYSADWAQQYADELRAEVLAPLKRMAVLADEVTLPDGTTLRFGQAVVDGFAVGDGWARFVPGGTAPILLSSPTSSVPVDLDALGDAAPDVMDRRPRQVDFSSLARRTKLHGQRAVHAGTVFSRKDAKKAALYGPAVLPEFPGVNPYGVPTDNTWPVVTLVRRLAGWDVTVPPVKPAHITWEASMRYLQQALGGEWSDHLSYESVIVAMNDRSASATERPSRVMAVMDVFHGPPGQLEARRGIVVRDGHWVAFFALNGELLTLPQEPVGISLLPFRGVWRMAPLNYRTPDRGDLSLDPPGPTTLPVPGAEHSGVHRHNAPDGLLESRFPWLSQAQQPVNCQQAALRTDQHLSGDFTNRSTSDDFGPEWRDHLAAAAGREGGRFEPVASFADIVGHLRELGHDARAIVYGKRVVRGIPVSGHVFNAINLDGEVHFIDRTTNDFADLTQYNGGIEVLITENNGVTAQLPVTPGIDEGLVHPPPRGHSNHIFGISASDSTPLNRHPDLAGVSAAVDAALRRADHIGGMRQVEQTPAGTYMITGPLGDTFTATVRVGGVEANEVMRATVDTDRKSLSVRVSPRAAIDGLPFQVTYVVGVAQAILSGTPAWGQDFLSRHSDPASDDPTLTPEDHGRANALLAYGDVARDELRALIEEMGLAPDQEGADKRLAALPDERMREVVRRYAPEPDDLPGRMAFLTTRLLTGTSTSVGYGGAIAAMQPQIAISMIAAAAARALAFGLSDPFIARREDAGLAAEKEPAERELAEQADARREALFGPLLERCVDVANRLRTGEPPRPVAARPSVQPEEQEGTEENPADGVGWKHYAVRRAFAALAGSTGLGLTVPLGTPVPAALALLAMNWAPAVLGPVADANLSHRKQNDKAARAIDRLKQADRVAAEQEQQWADLVKAFLDLIDGSAVHHTEPATATGDRDRVGMTPFLAREGNEGAAQIGLRSVPRGLPDTSDPTWLSTMLSSFWEYFGLGLMQASANLTAGLTSAVVFRADQDAKAERRLYDQLAKLDELSGMRHEVVRAVLDVLAANDLVKAAAGADVLRKFLNQNGFRATAPVRHEPPAPVDDPDRPSGLSSELLQATGMATGGSRLGMTALGAGIFGLPGIVVPAAVAAAAEAATPFVERKFKSLELKAEDAAAEPADAQALAQARARAEALQRYLVRLIENGLTAQEDPGDRRPVWRRAVDLIGRLVPVGSRAEPLVEPPAPSAAGRSRIAAEQAYQQLVDDPGRLLAEPGKLPGLPARLDELETIVKAADRVDRMTEWTVQTGQTRPEVAARNELIAAIQRYNALASDHPLELNHLFDGVHAGNGTGNELRQTLPNLLTAVAGTVAEPLPCQVAAVLTDRHLADGNAKPQKPPRTLAGLTGREGWADRIAVAAGVTGARFQAFASVNDVAQRLGQLGPGARAIVHGKRSGNGHPVPGHVFNAVNIDGRVHFVDGSNTTYVDLSVYNEGVNVLITEDNGESRRSQAARPVATWVRTTYAQASSTARELVARLHEDPAAPQGTIAAVINPPGPRPSDGWADIHINYTDPWWRIRRAADQCK